MLELPLDSYTPEPISGCWLWMLGCTSAGYGVYTVSGTQTYAHRLSAQIYLGLAPTSTLHVLHKCDNPTCVNPEHLRIGTNAGNHHDSFLKGRRKNQYSGKSTCAAGHEFDGLDKHGYRFCRTCKNEKERARTKGVKRVR